MHVASTRSEAVSEFFFLRCVCVCDDDADVLHGQLTFFVECGKDDFARRDSRGLGDARSERGAETRRIARETTVSARGRSCFSGWRPANTTSWWFFRARGLIFLSFSSFEKTTL